MNKALRIIRQITSRPMALIFIAISILFVTSDVSAIVSTIDDQISSSITYTGNWDRYSGGAYANAMWGTTSFAYPSSSAQWSFNGSSVSYFYSMAYNRGLADIYIDNQFVERMNHYAPDVHRQVGKTWLVSPGPHTIKVVRVSNTSVIDLDAFASDIAYVGAGFYDDRNPILRKFGTWNIESDPNAFSDTSSYTTNAQAGMRFTFTGEHITYFWTGGPDRGIVSVILDGQDLGTIDLYSPNIYNSMTSTYTNVGSGIHILNVVNTGTKNPSSSGFRMDLDVLAVAAGTYDPVAAVNYADEYATTRNPLKYPHFDEWPIPGFSNSPNCNDCTNYLSQVLEQGGVPQIIGDGDPGMALNWFIDRNDYIPPNWGTSSSWRYTPDLFQHVWQNRGTRFQWVSGITEMVEGDFILLTLEQGPPDVPNHARIVVRVDGGIRLTNQHCVDRYHVPWNYNLNPDDSWTLFKVRY